ncbi:acyl-[acyl-carrier-protein] thioesterase [Pseudodesulfovibrio senegalensis]|uniref:Acyl-ACP thioesterase n=1 Tax=Pseudodesulfovibrio senegalensis TaxID=1721087 RepID=A0A6N6N5F0_9BACT|nr:acyl-ACP thioesterase domain-containing protein [Pseudodesulfovibrio senegalensis]KAB1443113.1 acyl-ACP thioesterase [Pseudodesulfovibrio senegalensis]
MNELLFTQPYRIRSYETGYDWKVTIPPLCNHLQDIASMHAERLGFGYADLHAMGCAWVLVRAFLRMDALPAFGEVVDVTTWPSGAGRTAATRDYEIRLDDRIVGRATSAWAIIDLESRKAVNAEEIMAKRKSPERDRALEFESRAVKRIREGEHRANVLARQGDEDVNRHVNSIRQVEFLLESCPVEWKETRQCVAADVQFRAECHAGEELVALCSPQDDGTARHALFRASDDREVARMQTWWQERK